MHNRRQMRMPRAATLALLCFGLLLAACTRSASTSTVPTRGPSSAGTDVIQIPDGQDATMAAIGTEVASQLTQTAVAVSGSGGGDDLTNVPPSATPIPLLPGQDTATPVPVSQPTATSIPGATPTTVPPPGVACPNPYTVKQGDWIYQIARDCGVSVSALIAANPGINPNVIKPGQLLNMPGAGPTPGGGAPQPASCTGSHTVVTGDTLYRLSYGCGLTVEQLAAANSIIYPYTIYPGQTLVYPS